LTFPIKNGTLAAVIFFKELSKKNKGVPAIIELDGTADIKTVSDKLMGQLK
jgi:hypothetical protein